MIRLQHYTQFCLTSFTIYPLLYLVTNHIKSWIHVHSCADVPWPHTHTHTHAHTHTRTHKHTHTCNSAECGFLSCDCHLSLYVLILCHAMYLCITMNVFCVAQAVNTTLSLSCCLVSYISACAQFVIALVLSAVAQCTRDRCVHAPSQRSRAIDHRPTIAHTHTHTHTHTHRPPIYPSYTLRTQSSLRQQTALCGEVRGVM